jgi:DNA-directed RNA polymerase specialized sigma24 family protein
MTDAWRAWAAGDEQALQALDVLLRGLLAELLRYVRKNRGPILDSEGVVNEAYVRLLTKAKDAGYANIRNRSDLRGKLYQTVKFVLSEEKRRYSTLTRAGTVQLGDGLLMNILANEQSWDPGEDFLTKLQDAVRPVHKEAMKILEGLLNGLSSKEIAEELGMGLRNVQRIIREMRDAADKLYQVEL